MPPVLEQGCSQGEKPRGSEALPQHVHLHLWTVWYDFWQKDCTVQPPEEHAQKARNDECICCFSLEINILQPGTSNFSILKVAWASSRRSISKPCQTTPFFFFCQKQIPRKDNARRHVKLKHLDLENGQSTVCEICYKPFKNNLNLDDHKRRFHGIYKRNTH